VHAQLNGVPVLLSLLLLLLAFCVFGGSSPCLRSTTALATSLSHSFTSGLNFVTPDMASLLLLLLLLQMLLGCWTLLSSGACWQTAM
jgi:hypothetical protein